MRLPPAAAPTKGVARFARRPLRRFLFCWAAEAAAGVAADGATAGAGAGVDKELHLIWS